MQAMTCLRLLIDVAKSYLFFTRKPFAFDLFFIDQAIV